MINALPHRTGGKIPARLSRRDFLRHSLATSGLAVTGPLLWSCSGGGGSGPGGTVLAPSLTKLGVLGEPDALGLRLPEGFSARILAESGIPVVGDLLDPILGPVLGYDWHTFPDGGATFPAEDGGWVYVSNSESVPGGVGALQPERSDCHATTPPVIPAKAH